MQKEFPFEDFTIIMARNCNLGCEYCPLNHFEGNITDEILEKFFEWLLEYNNHNFIVTLFWWEPLLNKRWFKFILEYLTLHQNKYVQQSLNIELKIITNGTLISDEYIKIFQWFQNIKCVELLIDVSIDGDRETQLKQRGFKNAQIDYYDQLSVNINKLIDNNINIELFSVMAFNNRNLVDNIIYLLKNFKVPLFLMPVDLTHEYIHSTINLNQQIRDYLIEIWKTIDFIKLNNLSSKIENFKSQTYYDLKLPPIGPTLDYNWDFYTTRDFLFLMDKKSKFDIIGNINTSQFRDIIWYFTKENFSKIENEALHTYYWDTYIINKKIWDYFSNKIFTR